jgi:hypothetical protein
MRLPLKIETPSIALFAMGGKVYLLSEVPLRNFEQVQSARVHFFNTLSKTASYNAYILI